MKLVNNSLDQENGLLGWITKGNTLRDQTREQDTSLALIVGWIECLLGIAESIAITAVIHVLAEPFVSPTMDSRSDVLARGIAATVMLLSLILANARFHGVPVSRFVARSRLLRSDRTASDWIPLPLALFLVASMGLAFLMLEGARQSRSLISLVNFTSWTAGHISEILMWTPLKEELMFRCVLLHRLLNRLPGHPMACAALASLLFSGLHAINLMSSSYSTGYVLLQIVLSGLIGFNLSISYLNGGSILHSFFTHAVNNASASLIPLDALQHIQSPVELIPLFGTVVFHVASSVRGVRMLAREVPGK